LVVDMVAYKISKLVISMLVVLVVLVVVLLMVLWVLLQVVLPHYLHKVTMEAQGHLGLIMVLAVVVDQVQ
jgi:hypothetical protein